MTAAKKKNLKLVKLPTFKARIDEEVIEDLKVLLARAKKGEFIGFAYFGVWKDGRTTTSFTCCADTNAMLGAVEKLKYRMLTKWCDD